MIQRCCVQWRLPDCGAFSWLPILHAKKSARKGRLQDIAELFSVPGKASSNDYEEHRNKEDRQQRRGQHPAHHAGANRILRPAAGTMANHQRHDPENKGQRGHQNRPQAHPRCLQRGLNDPFPFFLHQILGELDDQDRILGRQTDRGQESDLEVNVIIQPTQRGG